VASGLYILIRCSASSGRTGSTSTPAQSGFTKGQDAPRLERVWIPRSVIGGAPPLFSLPLSAHPEPSHEPFSTQTLAKTSRLRGATVTEGLCPYWHCATSTSASGPAATSCSSAASSSTSSTMSDGSGSTSSAFCAPSKHRVCRLSRLKLSAPGACAPVHLLPVLLCRPACTRQPH
jgi:hypothetical protein